MKNALNKFINLVYVPNSFCNLGCTYCYLGKLTDNKDKYDDIVTNLEKAVDKIKHEGYGIGAIKLHGAEISTIPAVHLDKLFTYIGKVAMTDLSARRDHFKASGTFTPHIKTNLYNYDKLESIYEKHQVTVSGSFDLPFKMHAKHRVTKNNKSTLDKILGNIKLLKDYKYGKGISCVVTKEHLEHIDEFIVDLKYMHEEIGFDMINNFYIMFGYDSFASEDKFQAKVSGTQQLSQEEMVMFYNKLKEAFHGTEYALGLYHNWFKEFLPGYCTFVLNCGKEQFLLQKNGNLYPCHRTQPDKDFLYGNIFETSFTEIVENAVKVVEKNEQMTKVNDKCLTCNYFKYCQLNCTLIRKETKQDISYTCSLQKELYKDNPERYPPSTDTERDYYIGLFMSKNNNVGNLKFREISKPDVRTIPLLTNEIEDKDKVLGGIIDDNEELKLMYKQGMFKLDVGGELTELDSALFAKNETHYIFEDDVVKLKVHKDYFGINCSERDIRSNHLLIMLLRDTRVTYGLEKRNKQEHIADTTMYYSQLLERSDVEGDYYVYDITYFINNNKIAFMENVKNLLYFTTKHARLYHYEMQKSNAFYHIQAVNLPFHHYVFNYIKDD